jgi:fructose-bisphosphate aldolase/2-amino-3,7-dideoxy-D-threo-hept-6-ulosonate synthase
MRAELGADIIKTNYTGEVDTFKEDKAVSCAVVIAGGPQTDSERELLQMVRDSIDAGGRGVSIGRNIFQAKDPTDLVRKIARVVHEGYDVDEAIRV